MGEPTYRRPFVPLNRVPPRGPTLAIYNGSRSGKCYTGHILDEGTGAATTEDCQWEYLGDDGSSDLIESGDIVVLDDSCPAYLESDADWQDSSAKYVTRKPGATIAETTFAKFDGSRSGKRYAGHLWTGSQGAAIQWIFLNDPGTDSIIGANEYVEVIPAPAWIASDAAYGAVETYGAKYLARSPIWGVLS